jgi:hypothetical protein
METREILEEIFQNRKKIQLLSPWFVLISNHDERHSCNRRTCPGCGWHIQLGFVNPNHSGRGDGCIGLGFIDLTRDGEFLFISVSGGKEVSAEKETYNLEGAPFWFVPPEKIMGVKQEGNIEIATKVISSIREFVLS